MEAGPVEIVCQMAKELGYKTKAEANLDGTSGKVWVQQIISADYREYKIAPYFTIMEIFVSGAILTCKGDHMPLAVAPLTIDLHEPDSISKFKELLEVYERESRRSMDSTLMMFAMQQMRPGDIK